MRLRWKAGLLLAIATTACTDPSAPSAISARFELTDVDGHGLPASSSPSGGAPGPTIIAGTMSLDQEGGAIISEDRKDSNGTIFTVTSTYKYVIKGSKIEFTMAPPCPIDAICTGPPTGEILDGGIRVRVVFPPGYPFQIYNFRTLPSGTSTRTSSTTTTF